MAPSNLKVYVDVKTNFRKDGVMIPVSLVWEDGTEYVIDRVTDIRPAAAAKAGGQGDRFIRPTHSIWPLAFSVSVMPSASAICFTSRRKSSSACRSMSTR